MVEHFDGEWELDSCTLDDERLTVGEDFKKKDAYTLEFEITLPPRTDAEPGKKVLRINYTRKHIRGGGRIPQPMPARTSTPMRDMVEPTVIRPR